MAQEVTKWQDENGTLHDSEDAANIADAEYIVTSVLDQAQADAEGDETFSMSTIRANRATLVTALEAMGE